MSERIHSFPPVIDDRARVLILGTAPSVKSLEHKQFYGHPRNYFWPLVYALFGAGEPSSVYQERLIFLQQQRLAVFDVIESCVREGSLDMNIREERPNDLPGLVRRYPNLRCFAFNGSKAYQTYRKFYGKNEELSHLALLKLPSSSPVPTPAMRTLEDRLEQWRAILPYVEN